MGMLMAMARATGDPRAHLLNPKSSMPWCAEITGTHPRYGLERQFLRHKTDYRDANRKATRGVMFWWTLESGRLYEVKYRTAWNRWHRRFVTVTDEGDIRDVSEQEAREWASGISAPMS